MRFLPIVERELRVAARAKATYRNRALAAGLVGAIAMAMLLFGSFSTVASRIGGALFQVLAGLALLFCLVEGVRKTADSLSEEKRDGTLGLLFLTDLTAYDIVFGKFTAMSVSSIYGLLAVLPMLAIPWILGGLTLGEFWRMTLALTSVLLFSLCAGITVSARSWQQRRAIGGTMLLVALAAGIPFCLGRPFFSLSPVWAFYNAFDGVYGNDSFGYWQSLAAAQAGCWLLLADACVMLPRRWQVKGEGVWSTRWRLWVELWRYGSSLRRKRLRLEMLDENPIYWLAGRNLNHRRLLWASIVLGGAVVSVFFYNVRLTLVPGFVSLVQTLNFVFSIGRGYAASMLIIWAVGLALKIRVASQACHCLAEARRMNSLEMLLATPLTVEQIIGGQITALQRTYVAPVFFILSFEVLAAVMGGVAKVEKLHYSEASAFIHGMLFLYIALFILDMMAVTWAGMWFGLSSKKESQAATKTILFVLIAPWLCLFFWMKGLPVLFGIPVFFIIWARRKVYREFRARASERQAVEEKRSSWPITEAALKIISDTA